MNENQERDRIAAEWARVGGGFLTEPAAYVVDLEGLVGRTAVAAPRDYRVLAVATTWLAQHSQLVNVRRLGKVAAELQELPAAILGAMLDIAHDTNSAADRLRTVQRHCRPLQRPRALFDRTEGSSVLRGFARSDALPAFDAWGLWQDELTLEFDAVRPVTWILEHCPELRLRALYGPALEASVMQELERGPTTIAAIAREVDASYSATHAAVVRLEGRGSLVSEDGHGVAINAPVQSWLDEYPKVARKHRASLKLTQHGTSQIVHAQ